MRSRSREALLDVVVRHIGGLGGQVLLVPCIERRGEGSPLGGAELSVAPSGFQIPLVVGGLRLSRLRSR